MSSRAISLAILKDYAKTGRKINLTYQWLATDEIKYPNILLITQYVGIILQLRIKRVGN